MANTYPTLASGSTGAYVELLQQLLNFNGSNLTVDGSFGPLTQAAVEDFQVAKIGTATGTVTVTTWSALLPSGGSAAQVAAFAEKYATGLNHPYITGGTSSAKGWDCTYFASYIYSLFNYDPGWSLASHFYDSGSLLDCASMWTDDSDFENVSGPQVGALCFEAGADGTVQNPGHVGIITSVNPLQMVAAADSAVGTIFETPSEVSGYMIPNGGFRSTPTPPLPPWPTPAGLTGAAFRTVKLSWTAVAGCNAYQYEVETASGASVVGPTDVVGESVIVMLDPGSYNFRVIAHVSPTNDWSAWSEWYPFTLT